MSVPKHWEPYAPSERTPWNLKRVVHLHRRAGFGATWPETQRDLREGPEASIGRLVRGDAAVKPGTDFAATAARLSEAAVVAPSARRLKAAWLYRILYGPDPLGEKLTLLWHDHFATGFAKVADVGMMWRQNESFRRHCRAGFAGLLNAAVRGPALLIYLDAQANRAGKPNENLARELMELFTLGVGHFTESDVKEAARALTGWTVRGGRFAELAEWHDAGEKTILGRRGRWRAADLLRMLLRHPATAVRLTRKLCSLFFGESAVPARASASLAAGLRERRLDVRWAVETILRSGLFFADANIGNRVLSPVEFTAGTVRALGRPDAGSGTMSLADWSGRMGQDLFDPPNVGGWPGGRNWITPRTMVLRANFVTGLVRPANPEHARPYDPVALARRHGAGPDAGSVIAFHSRLLFGVGPAPGWGRLGELPAHQAVAALLASPRAQLG